MKFARIVFGLGCVLLISALLLFRSTTAALTPERLCEAGDYAKAYRMEKDPMKKAKIADENLVAYLCGTDTDFPILLLKQAWIYRRDGITQVVMAALTTGGEERLFYFCHDAASGYHCMGIYPVPNDVACDCGNADALTCELYRAMAKSLTEDPSLLLHEPGVRRINSLLVEKATDGVRLLSVNR